MFVTEEDDWLPMKLSALLRQRFLTNVPLRTILIVPFVLQILSTVGLVWYFSFLNGQKAVNDLASQFRGELSNRIERELINDLALPPIINQLNATALAQGELSINNPKNLSQLVQQGKLLPFSYRIYCASQTGDHLSVGQKSFTDPSFSAWILERSAGQYFYSYDLDQQGQRVESSSHQETEYGVYDPRTRPWYQAALKQKKPIWSEVYVDFDVNTRLLMITAAQPVYTPGGQKIIGVCGTDVLLLQEFRRFLRNLKIGQTGAAFVIDRSGQIISSSSNEALSVGSGDDAKLVQATQSQNSLIRGTAVFLQQKFGNFRQIQQSQKLDFQLDGQRQFVQVLPYQDGQGLNWLIVVAVPESDFMGQIEASNRSTLYLCILALVVAVLIGILTARWVTRPILELNTAAKGLASGEWNRTVKFQRSDEVGDLARSFNNIAVQIQESFETLEAKNEALRLAEENYRSIFENALEGIFQASSKGEFLSVNLAYALLFGYKSPQEMLGAGQESFQQFFVDAGKREEFKILLTDHGEIRDFEFEAYRRDCSKIWVSTWIRVVKDAQANLLYYEGNCLDITQCKQQEQALRQQLRELQIEINNSQRTRQVAEITKTEYFQQLMAAADDLRYSDD